MQQDNAASGGLNDIPATGRALGNTSHWTVRRHIQQGNITAVRLGRRVFVTEKEIDRIKLEGLPRLKP